METPKTVQDVLALSRVDLENGIYLPDLSGIYFVSDSTRVLYVGKAVSLSKRWSGGHHRALEMVLSGSPMVITWLEAPSTDDLDALETELIHIFQPRLNRQGIRAETKLRSVRIDDEVWEWLQTSCPGKTTNHKLRILMDQASTGSKINEILEILRRQPLIEEIRAVFREVLEAKGLGKPATTVVTHVESRVNRESRNERAQREAADREKRARARSSVGDDPAYVFDPEYVQD